MSNRYTPEQLGNKLCEADALAAQELQAVVLKLALDPLGVPLDYKELIEQAIMKKGGSSALNTVPCTYT